MTVPQQAAPPAAAANRLRLGIAGFGVQGSRLAAAAAAVQGVEVTAVADVYDARLARARELFGDALFATRDYRALLARDVDAILIATPDHHHAAMARQSIAAGKDTYVEPPLAHTAQDAAALAEAAAAGGRVCYCGSGRSGSPILAKAKAVVASGRIGRVAAAVLRWGTSGAVDAWQTSFPPDASPESIDFTSFLGAAPAVDFDLKRFFRWRGYWDYGGGLAAARFAPMLAEIHELLALPKPARITAGGALQRWKDGRETPDVLTAVVDYADGPTVTLSATLCGAAPPTIELFGADAALVIEERGLSIRPVASNEAYGEMANTLPREYRDWYYMMHGMSNQGQLRAAPEPAATSETYDLPEHAAPPLSAQLTAFVNAVRTRSAAGAPLQVAADAAAVADRINVAYRTTFR